MAHVCCSYHAHHHVFTDTLAVGLEIVSPILEVMAGGAWHNLVRKFWESLDTLCFVETNQTCSTHIHISLTRKWTTTDIQSISAAALWFEGALLGLVPEHRRDNQFCKQLNKIRRFDGKGIQDCLNEIYSCKDIVALVDLLNEDGDRYRAVNFLNLYYGGLGTVEFRRAPGGIDCGHILAWANFTLAFVAAAIALGRSITQFPRTVGGVKRFLKATSYTNRGAQTAVFELDIRISNPPCIDVCQSLASETDLKSRKVEKRINAV
jgi:hypothetical protein